MREDGAYEGGGEGKPGGVGLCVPENARRICQSSAAPRLEATAAVRVRS